MLGLKIHFFMKSRPTACHGTTATMFGERSERNRAYMARLLMLVQLCEKSSRAEEAWLILWTWLIPWNCGPSRHVQVGCILKGAFHLSG